MRILFCCAIVLVTCWVSVIFTVPVSSVAVGSLNHDVSTGTMVAFVIVLRAQTDWTVVAMFIHWRLREWSSWLFKECHQMVVRTRIRIRWDAVAQIADYTRHRGMRKDRFVRRPTKQREML
ncbi:hypothetical protein BDR03DRAFT_714642 [Suillus americanus]|nr:hypothetical protein BDR03DRAFT_714642 [Suillus americanus]